MSLPWLDRWTKSPSRPRCGLKNCPSTRSCRKVSLLLELLEERNLLANGQLYLPFDGTLTGSEGEAPLAAVGTTFEPGILGQALHTGNPGYVRYATTGNITSTRGTVSFWIKPDWNGNLAITHEFFAAGNNFNNGMPLSIDGANNLRFLQWGA